jgi:type 1 fimbria pilin
MATAFRRKSDNKVVVLLTYLPDINSINFTSTNMFCTLQNGAKPVTFQDVNTNDFERIDDVTAPTSFFGNAMTYIDGTWAVDNAYVTLINNQRAAMRIDEQINPQV